jgi:ADP-heptose:LPS heptosyltransferase
LNLLLIQLKRIGDLILTVPAIAALRKAFPAASISLVAAHGSRELLPAIPALIGRSSRAGESRTHRSFSPSPRRKFDCCLDFSRTGSLGFLTLLSGAQRRITYDTIRREPLRQLSFNEFVPSQVRFVHTIDHHLALLAPLGVHDGSREFASRLPASAKARAQRSPRRRGWATILSCSTLALRAPRNFGSRDAGRRWPTGCSMTGHSDAC